MCEDRPSQHLPSVDPGQIWLIEHDPATRMCAAHPTLDRGG